MSALALAARNVLRNRRRSITTILVAAIGCAALLISGGFALYTYEMLADNAARESGHITVADKRFFEDEEETPAQFGIDYPENWIAALEHDDRIKYVLPRLSFSGLISNGDKSLIFSGLGADINAEANVRGDFLKGVNGNINFDKTRDGAPAILIGKELARRLKADVGSRLTLMTKTASGSMNAMDALVSSIVTTGWHEADKRLVLLDIGQAQRLMMTGRISSLSVYLSDAGNVQGIREELLSSGSGRLASRLWSEQAFYYESVKAIYDRIFGLLGFIIALLVLFSVSNTLATSVAERTREIGTFRALGSHPHEIVAQFVHEGMLIGIAGVLTGNLIGLAVASSLPYLGWEMPPPPGRSAGYPLLVSAPVSLYGAIDLLIVILCCVAAWFSSRKAARMPVMEALRHV
ncbi:MAG: FtsX-like permease family protein [Betaproteobacteria bacterium]|nr:FtsX-like permease family protein [Betaproteobacteria bacterium]